MGFGVSLEVTIIPLERRASVCRTESADDRLRVNNGRIGPGNDHLVAIHQWRHGNGRPVCNQCGQRRISGLLQLLGCVAVTGDCGSRNGNFSDGQPCGFRRGGLDALKARLEILFERFTAKLVVIVIEIRLQGDVAYDYGWHELTLTPKGGGQATHRRDRYVDIWWRNKEGKWKLRMYMDNQDVADPFQAEHTLGLGAQSYGTP